VGEVTVALTFGGVAATLRFDNAGGPRRLAGLLMGELDTFNVVGVEIGFGRTLGPAGRVPVLSWGGFGDGTGLAEVDAIVWTRRLGIGEATG
jgi:hypothetical protein